MTQNEAYNLQSGDTICHDETMELYRVVMVSKGKMRSGGWSRSITYSPVFDDQILYTRDYISISDKFSFVD